MTAAGPAGVGNPRAEGRGHHIVRPLAILIISVLLPLWLVVNAVEPEAYREWPALFAVSAYTGARLAVLVGDGNPRLYTFAFFLYCYLFLGLAPLVQLSSRSFPSVAPWVFAENNTAAVAITMLGIFAFEVGSLWQRRRSPFRTVHSSHRLSAARDWSVAAPRMVHAPRLYALVTISLGVSIVFIVAVGPAVFLQSRNEVFLAVEGGVANSSIALLVKGFVVGSLLVSFAGLVYVFRVREQGRRFGLGFCAVSTAAVSLYITNVFNSPRYLALVVLIGILASLGIFARAWLVRTSFTAALAGFLLIFPILGGFRNTVTINVPTRLETVLLSGDYDSFAQINNAVTYVNGNGIEFGRQVLGALLVWVPRSIWPNKPVSTSTLVADNMGYPFTNVSAPLWSELLVDFGVLGVILGFWAVGMALGRLDDNLVLAARYGYDPGVAAMVVPFYLIIILRGALLTTVPTLLIMLGCILFISAAKTSSPERRLRRGGNRLQARPISAMRTPREVR